MGKLLGSTSTYLVLLLVLVLATERNEVEATAVGYNKRPPINGSIFGKRGYEATGNGGGDPATSAAGTIGDPRAYNSYTSYCEMAWKTCFAQYAAPENSR